MGKKGEPLEILQRTTYSEGRGQNRPDETGSSDIEEGGFYFSDCCRTKSLFWVEERRKIKLWGQG